MAESRRRYNGKKYIAALQKMFPNHSGKFFDYAVAVKDFANLQIDWDGKNTTVQQQADVEDLGVFDTPGEFFAKYTQTYRGIKKFANEHFGRKIMTRKVAKIRKKA